MGLSIDTPCLSSSQSSKPVKVTPVICDSQGRAGGEYQHCEELERLTRVAHQSTHKRDTLPPDI